MNPPPSRHYSSHCDDNSHRDESTQELPPVITERARVSLPFSVILPALITLAGAVIWTTKFYVGQVETQAHVIKLEANQLLTQAQLSRLDTTLADIRNEQALQGARIQAELTRIKAALGPPLSGITKSTPTTTLLTSQDIP